MEDIGHHRNSYRTAVRKFLSEYSESLTAPEKEQWKADLNNVVTAVSSHKIKVLEKVNQFASKPVPMSEFEKASIRIQEEQLKLQQQSIQGKKDQAIAQAKPLMVTIVEKCTELEDEIQVVPITELQSGEDHQVTRVMNKLAGWKSSFESVEKCYQEFEIATAVYKLSNAEHEKVKSSVDRTKSLLTDVVAIAEDQDLKRKLFSLDINTRVEQVKWTVFSGDFGEDFFKFKKDFLDAASQNKTSTKNQIFKLRENLRSYAMTPLLA